MTTVSRYFLSCLIYNPNLLLLPSLTLTKLYQSIKTVRRIISRPLFPDSTPVFHEAIMGHCVGYNIETTEVIDFKDMPPFSIQNMDSNIFERYKIVVTSAQSLTMRIDLPDLGEETDALEKILLKELSDFRERNNFLKSDDKSSLVMEYFTMGGYETEMLRSLIIDMPLVGALMIVMLIFTVSIFIRRDDKVQSRGSLGLYGLASIGFALLTGHGIVWCVGVPYSTVTLMLPFIVAGVGLDDMFIITGSYFRLRREKLSQKKDSYKLTNEEIILIIRETLEEVAISISMTTLTTLIAFAIGSGSGIPAVRWLSSYAGVCLFIVFLYQITCFVALLYLDEKRVQANRYDLFFWLKSKNEDEVLAQKDCNNENFDASNDIEQDTVTTVSDRSHSTVNTDTAAVKSGPERLMSWYADQLLKPSVKVIVLLSFAAFFAFSVYSAMLLQQEFNVNNYIPKDSFMASFVNAYENHSSIVRQIGVYFRYVDMNLFLLRFCFYFPPVSAHTIVHLADHFFRTRTYRNVDQSQREIQLKMLDYVKRISQLPQIGEDPPFFWVRDFAMIAASKRNSYLDLDSMTFNQKLDLALSNPQVHQMYDQDIVRDPISGNITASRTYLYVRHLDLTDVQDQIDLLIDQREITVNHAMNKAEHIINNQFNFFTFDELYFYWELYATIVGELIFTMISCIIVVSVIAYFFIPHWSSVFFVSPLLVISYSYMLGKLHFVFSRT